MTTKELESLLGWELHNFEIGAQSRQDTIENIIIELQKNNLNIF